MNTLTLITISLTLALLFTPFIKNNTTWRAAVTPLASIIGSGFLVLGPTLGKAYGLYAPLIMAGLCLLGGLFGSAIRHNIKIRAQEKQTPNQKGMEWDNPLEKIASWALAFAYIISVAYYLNLFGAFGVRLLPEMPEMPEVSANILTSLILIFILLIGWTKGFKALERAEIISVNIKLAVIIGLLVTLSVYFTNTGAKGALILPTANIGGWEAITLALGLIITIQGFEISRYLGENYTAETRIRSMRLAQIISSIIYLIYIPLITYAFHFDTINGSDETAIIEMMNIVASYLPLALIMAALCAQFSAAIADTAGCGGLVSELSKNRISNRTTYVILVIFSLVLTWTSNLFEIITYASRAFALYYALQAAIAYKSAACLKHHWLKRTLFAALTLTGLAIIIFSTSFEGG